MLFLLLVVELRMGRGCLVYLAAAFPVLRDFQSLLLKHLRQRTMAIAANDLGKLAVLILKLYLQLLAMLQTTDSR